jgi:hypothetical protein
MDGAKVRANAKRDNRLSFDRVAIAYDEARPNETDPGKEP